VASTLAYYDTSKTMPKKSFIVKTPLNEDLRKINLVFFLEFDEMSSQLNVKSMKCQVNEMASQQNVKSTKCQVNKMSS
jgi:hypothetical protein